MKIDTLNNCCYSCEINTYIHTTYSKPIDNWKEELKKLIKIWFGIEALDDFKSYYKIENDYNSFCFESELYNNLNIHLFGFQLKKINNYDEFCEVIEKIMLLGKKYARCF